MQQDEYPKDLPPKYYLHYFKELLSFVEKHYSSLLIQEEVDFLNRFAALSEDAQCLFIRFSNRSKSCFRVGKLQYSEISDLPACLQELLSAGLIKEVEECTQDNVSEDNVSEILGLYTKDELLHTTRALEPEVMPLKSIKKQDLVRWLRHEYGDKSLYEALSQTDPIVAVQYEMEVMIMKFLFFGNRYSGMTEFVIRDLGHVKYQHFEEEQLSVRFANRKEMEDSLMIALTKETFYAIQNQLPPEEIYDWFMNWQTGVRENISTPSIPAMDQLVVKIGTWLEKKKMPQQALIVFQLTEAAPSRERRVRLLAKMEEHEEALALCEEIALSPQNADERFFAADFTARMIKKKKRIVKSTTQALKMAEPILLPISRRFRVEQGIMDHYQACGYETFFSENQPWRNLFGLLFWDIIHDTNVKAIHNPLQRVPSDFFLPDFYFKRSENLNKRKQQMQDKSTLSAYLKDQFEVLYGTTNVLVSWYPEALNRVLKIIEFLNIDQIFAVLFEMAINLRENTRGFPDLFIWKNDECAFLEVKSPTDHLSAQQLHWQHFFEKQGIPCRIIRIKWEPSDVSIQS
ncbi:VRR-NUC domain-containing protein [Dyadobacter tibetensis]|uniref:VRR-NUC domain-containing protein n=1 Tax=Dyadobacter tibetensis TaxID=1211851 RepID=UPI00046F5877|nr:VRR-NUC domain-containing protein [Dyadobacter tibetensis]